MYAVIVLAVSAADHAEASQVVAEQVQALNRYRWDDSEQTCERILAWLHDDRQPMGRLDELIEVSEHADGYRKASEPVRTRH